MTNCNLKLAKIFALFVLIVTSCKRDKDDSPENSNVSPGPAATNEVSDIEGNVYHTILVGGSRWMVDDFRGNLFSNGDSIANVTASSDWIAAGNSAQPAWSWYNNNPDSGAIYGRLYNGFAVLDDRNICPSGWHIPSSAEWKLYVQSTGDTVDGVMFGDGIESPVFGEAMKDASYWTGSASNASGFSARPGGIRKSSGSFEQLQEAAFWWCSDGSVSSPGTLGARKIVEDDNALYRTDANKEWGLKVRCRENVYGCVDESAYNYNIEASHDNGSCQYGLPNACGALYVHNPNLSYGSVQDIDGNSYRTITIGTQTWMAENLRTEHYNNGTVISNWSYPMDSVSYKCLYGLLYDYSSSVNASGICPTGWHLPSRQEWTDLRNYLGGDSIAGGFMKSLGTLQSGHGWWNEPNENGNNQSGFSALPGGLRYAGGFFGQTFNQAIWWSSVNNGNNFSWACLLQHNYDTAIEQVFDNSDRLSVRCLRD